MFNVIYVILVNFSEMFIYFVLFKNMFGVQFVQYILLKFDVLG